MSHAPHSGSKGGRLAVRAIGLTVTFLLLSIITMNAQSVPQDTRRTITVRGEAEIRVVPDEVRYDFTVETTGKRVAVAEAENKRRYEAFLKFVDSMGIERRMVQTSQASIYPRYAYDDKGTQRFDTYVSTRTLTITLRDFTKIPRLLDGAVDAGITGASQGAYTTTKLREHRDDARLQAVRASREKASAMATELGMRVGTPLTVVEETYESYYPRPMNQNVMMRDGDMSAATAEVVPGELAVSAAVVITFDLVEQE